MTSRTDYAQASTTARSPPRRTILREPLCMTLHRRTSCAAGCGTVARPNISTFGRFWQINGGTTTQPRHLSEPPPKAQLRQLAEPRPNL